MLAGMIYLHFYFFKKKYFFHPRFLKILVFCTPLGFIAIEAGWTVTEVGRQPWIIQGLMRTADASSGHSFAQMSLTLALFVVVYFALFGAGLGYMMRLVRKGPVTDEGKQATEGGPGRQRTPSRPLSAADEEPDDSDTPSGRS